MTKRIAIVVAALLVGGSLFARERIPERSARGPAAEEAGIRVYFSPDGGCEAAVVEQIARAQRSVDFQAFSFTSNYIAKALGEAQARGVKVRAVLDAEATGDSYSGAAYLLNHGVSVHTDGEHPVAHNKVIIIDGETVITGSFNFTIRAERSNAENLLVLTGKPKLATAYEKNFETHLGHAKKYAGVRR